MSAGKAEIGVWGLRTVQAALTLPWVEWYSGSPGGPGWWPILPLPTLLGGGCRGAHSPPKQCYGLGLAFPSKSHVFQVGFWKVRPLGVL